MRSRPARRAHRVLGASVAVVAMLATFVTAAEPAFAHVPHDVIANVAVSPAYATDRTVFAISDNRAIRSNDGGKHWVETARGLTGEPLARFATSPSDPDVLYLCSRGGGVYRSDDQGTSWRPTNTGPSMTHIAELAVSPTSPDVVVAAAGLFGGLFRTVDGGDTWSRVPGIGKVNTVTFVPGHDGRVVIGRADGRIDISDDDGATFRQVGTSPGDTPITAAAVGTKKARATLFAGTKTGDVLRSVDAGDSWEQFGPGIADQQITSLAVSGDYSADRMLWASTWRKGAYRSTDGAKTWESRFGGLTRDRQAQVFGLPVFQALAVAPGPSGNQRLFLAGYDSLFKSSVDGSRWKAVETLSEYVTGLAVSPDYAEDGTVVVNTYVKGVYVSRNGGKSFVSSSDGLEQPIAAGNEFLPLRRMHNVVFSPGYAEDRTIFTATWTNFVESTDGGKTWKSIIVSPPPPDEDLRQFVIAVSPSYARDQTLFLGTRQGDVYRSTRGGAAGSWADLADLGARVRSIVVSPGFESDRTLFAGTEKGIFTSSRAGGNWTPTGPEGISLLAISPDFASDRTVFAGTERGLFATRDAGASWSASGAAPLAGSKVEAVALSPNFENDGTVLASIAGTGLFRSTDGGRSYRAVGSSLLKRGLVIADFENPTSGPIQFSPTFAADRTVYAYGQQSVVRSTDGGDTWNVLDIPAASELVRAHKRSRS